MLQRLARLSDSRLLRWSAAFAALFAIATGTLSAPDSVLSSASLVAAIPTLLLTLISWLIFRDVSQDRAVLLTSVCVLYLFAADPGVARHPREAGILALVLLICWAVSQAAGGVGLQWYVLSAVASVAAIWLKPGLLLLVPIVVLYVFVIAGFGNVLRYGGLFTIALAGAIAVAMGRGDLARLSDSASEFLRTVSADAGRSILAASEGARQAAARFGVPVALASAGLIAIPRHSPSRALIFLLAAFALGPAGLLQPDAGAPGRFLETTACIVIAFAILWQDANESESAEWRLACGVSMSIAVVSLLVSFAAGIGGPIGAAGAAPARAVRNAVPALPASAVYSQSGPAVAAGR